MSDRIVIIPGDALLDKYPGGVPMREAMIVGPCEKEVFSPSFLATRAAWHRETLDDYKQKVFSILPPEEQLKNNELTLVFGHEAFCQINLLTVLAYLSQLGRQKEATISLIDEFKSNAPVRSFAFSAWENVKIWYETLLINKRAFRSDPALWPELKKAAALYLLLREEQNEITDIIDENPNLSENALVRLLLSWDKDYGLSDDIFLSLIRTRRAQTKKANL